MRFEIELEMKRSGRKVDGPDAGFIALILIVCKCKLNCQLFHNVVHIVLDVHDIRISLLNTRFYFILSSHLQKLRHYGLEEFNMIFYSTTTQRQNCV